MITCLRNHWDPVASKTASKASLQLLAYRGGMYDPQEAVAQLPEPLRKLILHMTQRDPGVHLAIHPHGLMTAARCQVHLQIMLSHHSPEILVAC